MRWNKSFVKYLEIFMRLNMTEISQNIFMTEKNSQHYQERNFMEREIISIVLKKIMNGPMNHFPMKIS